MDITFSEAAEYLKSHDNYVLFTHASADGDTLGSAFALALMLAQLGKKATVFNPEPIPERLNFLSTESGLSVTNILPDGEHTLVSVDIASVPMLRGMQTDVLESLVFDLSIDHHKINTIPCKQRLIFDSYPATGEIIAQLGDTMGISLSNGIAYQLYAAISSDSGCFRYSSTRPETHIIAAKLLKTGIDFAKINRLLFENKSKSQIALEQFAYNSLEFYYGGKVCVVSLDKMPDGVDADSDVDCINQIPRQIAGVEVSMVIRRKDDEIKVSLRSNDYYDVAALASSFGGGGHVHAAGCRFRTSIEDAKAKLLDELANEFNKY